MWHEWNWGEYEIYCNELNNPIIDFVSQWLLCFSISYHDLFSKDSGLIEFVEWQPLKKASSIQLKILYEYWIKDYNYIMMSLFTAEEKIKYFLDNAIIPTK